MTGTNGIVSIIGILSLITLSFRAVVVNKRSVRLEK